MKKSFKDLETGDKIYELELSGTKIKRYKGEPLIKTMIVRRVDNSRTFLYVVFEGGLVIYPKDPESDSYVYVNSKDMSIYNSLNANIYSTSKKACIEAAINAIKEKTDEQKLICKKINDRIDENMVTIDILEKNLETAGFPDTVLEFAEMALD